MDPKLVDPAVEEMEIGYNNPDCLDSDIDYMDENDCEAIRCQREAYLEFYS